MFVMQQSYLLQACNAAVSAILNVTADPVTCNLFQNNYTPTLTSQLSDFTVADYTGYAAVGMADTWGGATWQTQEAAVAYSSTAVFAPTGTAVTNTIYGYYLLDHSGNLLGGERLANPVNLLGPTTILHIVIPFGIADAGIPGVSW